MKNITMSLFLLFVAVGIMQAQTNSIKFNYLGTYNNLGVPDYLEAQNDLIDSSFIKDINKSLPEKQSVVSHHPSYISQNSETDLLLNASANVWVTFVHEGAGYTNALGFYTYNLNNPPKTVNDIKAYTIIFPNVSYVNSGGGLISGNKVKIGRFDANTGIGWFLVSDGFKNGSVSNSNLIVYSEASFNPEPDKNLKAHTVLLNDSTRNKLILGFEDMRRDQGSDEDFNDVLFYITADPYSAVNKNSVAVIDKVTPPAAVPVVPVVNTPVATTITKDTSIAKINNSGQPTVNNNTKNVNVNNNTNNNANTNTTTTTVVNNTSTTTNTNTNLNNNTNTNNNTNNNTNTNSNNTTTVINNTTIINNSGGGNNKDRNGNVNNNSNSNSNVNNNTNNNGGANNGNPGRNGNNTGGYNSNSNSGSGNSSVVTSNIVVCNVNGITLSEFEILKSSIKKEYVESNKPIIIKQAVRSKRVSVSQIVEMLKLISVASYRYDMAVYLFDYTCDKSGYFQVNDVLLPSYSRDLNQYLQGKSMNDDNVTTVNTSVSTYSNNAVQNNMQNNTIQNTTTATTVNTVSSACGGNAMSEDDFGDLKDDINAQAFSDTKFTILKEAMPGRCVSTRQVIDLINLCSFESDRLNFAKYLYDFTGDKNNYYKVNKAFSFSSTIDELNQYLKTRR